MILKAVLCIAVIAAFALMMYIAHKVGKGL